MAIRTHRSQVSHTINSVLRTNGREFDQMMYVDELLADVAVHFFEAEVTDTKSVTVLGDPIKLVWNVQVNQNNFTRPGTHGLDHFALRGRHERNTTHPTGCLQ